jgi:hypothetical protein
MRFSTQERGEATDAIRGLIERITLTPGAKQGVPESVLVVKPFAVSQISTAVANLLNEAR